VWIWQLDRARKLCRFESRFGHWQVDLPMVPMHGTVGVAPANLEVRSSLVPDAHGGNMDTPEMQSGVTCYLGVNVEGAMFSIGDGHARQGEGETCGVAAECAMDTVLDAYQLASQTVESPLANVVDTNYTSVAKLRKQWLPKRSAMNGAHARLSELADGYRSAHS
jgi:acetamidase/formamidase